MTTAGDIGKETGYAVSSMVFSKILGVDWWEVAKRDRGSWKEGKYKFICDAVRALGRAPDLSGKRLLLTVWPVRQC